MIAMTLTELYESGNISARLYNALRYEFVTSKDETGGLTTLSEVVHFIEVNGINACKRFRHFGIKSFVELNDLVATLTNVNYLKSEKERLESESKAMYIDTLRKESLKLVKSLMGDDIDFDSVNKTISVLNSLKKSV
jgi:hypothetical protein